MPFGRSGNWLAIMNGDESERDEGQNSRFCTANPTEIHVGTSVIYCIDIRCGILIRTPLILFWKVFDAHLRPLTLGVCFGTQPRRQIQLPLWNTAFYTDGRLARPGRVHGRHICLWTDPVHHILLARPVGCTERDDDGS